MALVQLVPVVFWLGFVAVFVLVAVYAERKVSAFIQDRLGPTENGPYGLLQTPADVLKLLTKEAIVPAAADRRLFLLAPLVVFASVFAGFAVIPFAPGWVGSGLNVGILFLLAFVSIEVIGILMAGWGSNNKYALLGGVRSVAQIIAYEVPAGLALLAAVLMYGSFSLGEIAAQQGTLAAEAKLLGAWDVAPVGGLTAWGVVRYPHLLLVFVIFFIATLAEANRAPFDIPEAESELIAGFHVEYSGFRFAIFFLAEYASMLIACFLAAFLFFGGWNTPLPNLGSVRLADWTMGAPGTLGGAIWGALWLVAKALVLFFIQLWVRWSYPRLRADQLMRLCWQYLTPAALLLVLLSAAWKVWEVSG
ncbi:MAG: NADH-quinone oxidoreductase subunit NuoH [Bacteroidia bacterium]|nr:NADH-quinone oxidoreductase subunit NuoH [Bacteroidia bacterium]